MSEKGHPLPRSDEARHNEIPEHLMREKGRGDDDREVVQPAGAPVDPDGEPYLYEDLGRGPSSDQKGRDMVDERRDDAGGELPRDQDQDGSAPHGRQLGGGPGAADMANPGGSSGAGGYGKAQNQQLHQGQQQDDRSGRHGDAGLDRGARFDERQGGGRGSGDVTVTATDLADDQRAHQDRGQSGAESEVDDR